MKVRSGYLSASEGAALLGISRKTYYKWENRALEAMLSELEEKKAGRPEVPDHIKSEADLKSRLETLEAEKEMLQKQLELKDLVHQIELDELAQRVKGRKKKK